MRDKIKEVLMLAVQLVESRSGDVVMDDGDYAKVDIAAICHLESALCEALGSSWDDARMSELGPKIKSLDLR